MREYKEGFRMRALDIVKPVCTGFVCGAVLAVLSKPFKLHVQVGKRDIRVSSEERSKREA